jgi:hypothetical protein
MNKQADDRNIWQRIEDKWWPYVLMLLVTLVVLGTVWLDSH